MSEQTDTAKAALTNDQRKVLRSLARRQERIVKYRAALQSEYDGRLDDLFAARRIVPPALVEDICAYAGITESAYRAILRNAKERNGKAMVDDPQEAGIYSRELREAEMRIARENGATLAELAERFGMSIERVKKVMRKPADG